MPESSQVKGIGCSSAECRTPPTRPFTQSPLHRNSYMLGAFCTEHNVQECLSHINQEVSSLGLSSLWTELGGGSQLNIVAVLNCMHDLIQLHHRGLKTLENMEVEQLKASSRSDYLQLTTTHLKEQLELSKRENTGLLERERQLQLKTKSLQNCLKNEKEEVQKLQNIIASRASQYNHDMKRKEREFTKLKERLNQLLADKKERKQAIDVLNNIGRADGKRSLWKTEKTEAKHEGEMYKTLLSSYDTRQQELMLENAELRKVLQQMKIDMVSILSSRKTPHKSNKSEHNGAQAASEEEEEEAFDPSKENIELYCTNAREKLTNSIRLQWRRLKSHVEKLDSQVSLAKMDESYKNDSIPRETHEDEMNRLKLEVQQCRDFIQTQQQLLQQLSSPCDEEPASLLNDGHMLQEKERLREEWKTLEEQRKIFERERGNFTEAAIRLSHERQAFEEDRATWIKHQFLSLSPFGESKKPLLSKSTSAFLITEMDERAQLAREKLIECHADSASSTPRCAPLASPSTAELYRTVCLIPENGSKKPKKKPEDVEEPGSLCGRGAAQRKRWNGGEDLSIFSLTLEENSS